MRRLSSSTLKTGQGLNDDPPPFNDACPLLRASSSSFEDPPSYPPAPSAERKPILTHFPRHLARKLYSEEGSFPAPAGAPLRHSQLSLLPDWLSSTSRLLTAPVLYLRRVVVPPS